MADMFNVADEIITGTKDVFSTMLMVDLESETIVENTRCEIQSNLTSMIGLGGGIRGGYVYRCFRHLAAYFYH